MKTRLIKTALVAAVAGITLIGTATAASADPETTAVEGTPGRDINGIGVYRDGDSSPSSAHPLSLTTDGDTQVVYCIDLNHSLQEHAYTEEDWDSSGVKSLGKIKWLLTNSYPNVDVDDVLGAAKATLPDTYTAEQKTYFVYAATQAAIWHFSDGFDLDVTKSTDVKTADDKPDAVVNAAVLAVYQDLTTRATDLPDPGKPNLAFNGPDGSTGQVGKPIGPFKVDTNLGEIALTVTGGKAVDKDGKDVTTVKGGDEFFLISDKPGKIELSGKGEVNVPIGRIFVSKTDPDGAQKLILAGSLKKPGEAHISVTVAAAPTTPPGPGLAVTGSSLTIMGLIGAALLAGGFALVVFMRRRRAAAATWGSDDDGIA